MGKTSLPKKKPASFRKTSNEKTLADILLEKVNRDSFVPELLPRLLQLPRPVRVIIWRHCHYKHFPELRSTCKTIAHDIDNYLGISALVDERDEEFEENVPHIAIRHATIVHLPSLKIIEKLKDPNLLVELSIKGPISTSYFSYFMEYCPNISSLTLNFTPKMLGYKYKGALFPQDSPCLHKLKTLKVFATTKKEKDLIYICDNITALINEMMEARQKIVELHVTLSYRTPSPFLDYLVAQILILAQKNNESLQELYFQARESIVAGASASAGEGGSKQSDGGDSDGRRSSGGSGAARRATEMVKSKQSLMKAVPISLIIAASNSKILALSDNVRTSMFDNNDPKSLQSLENYLSKCTFSSFAHLRTAMIVLNSHWFPYAQKMLEQAHKIKHLKLEACDGVMKNCWLNFEGIVKTTRQTLTILKLFNVSYEDESLNPLPLDFSIFKPCKSLKHFFFSSVKRENVNLPKVKNVANLPKTLIDIEIWWVTFTGWQWLRLLRRKKLESLRVAYVTASESSFGWFLFVLRWLIKLKWTRVEVIVLTDFKIKFRNKRAAIKKLRKAIDIQIEYGDHDETFLAIDRGRGRQSQHSIPSIDSG